MNKIVQVIVVFLGGAFGALLSVWAVWFAPLWSSWTLTTAANLLLLPAIKGGVAAGLGVYLLFSFDASKTRRAFFFAILCGYCFPSIFAYATGLGTRLTNGELANQAVARSTDRINATAPMASPQLALTASAVLALRDASIAIINEAPNVTDSSVKREAVAAVHRAVADLRNAAISTGDSAPVDAIVDIGQQAAGTRSLRPTSDLAVQQLRSIQTDERSDSQTKKTATSGINQIENSSPTK